MTKKASQKSHETRSRIESKYGADGRTRADKVVVQELQELYQDKLLPIEVSTLFHKFHAPQMLPSEIGGKPTLLLLGQYSVGKTSFIRHLIKADYPGIHVGPEPTTDRFIAVVHGIESKIIKGNAVTGVSSLPFAGLSTFGTGFLNKFEAAVVDAPLLQEINIIDTPGVLSGEKQRTSRGYDFAKVSRWFAERSDLILLVFDAYKLDISDEFKSVIEELHPHEDKVHCVLNKADQLDQEALMRVYGALLWSMGKIFRGAEVTRIYVGSFVDQPLARPEYETLFDKDRKVLMNHLQDLPKMCSMRKVNEMVKRIRLTIVHVCILGHLRSKMPWLWGKERTRMHLINTLQETFDAVKNTYRLADGDFPNIDEFRSVLQRMDFYTFRHTDRKMLNTLQDILISDIPRIITYVAGVDSIDETGPDGDDGEDTFGSIDARAEQILKRSFVNLFEDTREGFSLGNAALYVGVVIAFAALAIGSLLEDHSTLRTIFSQLTSSLNSISSKNKI